MMIPKRRLLTLIFASLCFKKLLLIKSLKFPLLLLLLSLLLLL